MDDAAVVRVGDRVADLEEDLEPLLEPLGRARRRFRIVKPLVEIDPLHELHREVRHAVRRDGELVHGHDVRVLELAGHLRFGDEAVAVERHLASTPLSSRFSATWRSRLRSVAGWTRPMPPRPSSG